MNDHDVYTQLASQPIDYVTSAVKGILGTTPFVGSLLAELAGIIIPQQRIERIAKFAELLEKRLASIEKEFIKSQFTDEHFSDLFEEGLIQATRSLTEERREYLANLITNSLSYKDIDYIESKHLLRLLNEINDIEIIWLRFYSVETIVGDEEFREKHSAVLTPVIPVLSDPPEVRDKYSLQNSYKEHLSRLGLLEPRYKINSKTHLPEFDNYSGGQNVSGYRITTLGRLLLRQIGLSNTDEKNV